MGSGVWAGTYLWRWAARDTATGATVASLPQTDGAEGIVLAGGVYRCR